ncbi:MAG TPA: flagellar basal body rod protein FlgB [Burkholderiaceae bacterium]|nr:flagellar basal body rod protein FlgB [Burkholderiaceae bacterium]
MSIDFNKALGIHAQALQLRAERTRVLASNLANESTPGFQARDMDFAASLRAAEAEHDGLHLQTVDDEADTQPLYRVPFHPSADGNTVELGVEQAAFAQNASDFQMSLTFLNIKLKGLAKAIGGQ